MKRSRYRWGILSLILVMSLIVQACSKEQAPPEPVLIRVMTYDGTLNRVAPQIKEKFPHVVLSRMQPYGELIGHFTEITDWDAYYEEVARNIEAQQPDIVFLSDGFELARLAETGLLLNLEPYIQRKSFQPDNYPSSVLDGLRMYGNGQLLSVTDLFFAQGLFYNRTLLETYNIPLPRNDMTWEETFEIASRVPKDGGELPLIGFYKSPDGYNPWAYVRQVGMSAGLQFVDWDENKVLIDSPSWAQAWRTVIDAYESGALSDQLDAFLEDARLQSGVPRPVSEPPSQAMPFMNGQAVFYHSGFSLIPHLQANELPFEWGVVTTPVDAESGQGLSLSYGAGYAILRSSPNIETAWSILEYLTGEERALSYPPFAGYTETYLPVRRVAAFEPYAAFYEQPQSMAEISRDYHIDANFEFVAEFELLADEAFRDIMDGSKTLDQALADLQSEAQVLLDAMKE